MIRARHFISKMTLSPHLLRTCFKYFIESAQSPVTPLCLAVVVLCLVTESWGNGEVLTELQVGGSGQGTRARLPELFLSPAPADCDTMDQ